jgi:hypothetical protein
MRTKEQNKNKGGQGALISSTEPTIPAVVLEDENAQAENETVQI